MVFADFYPTNPKDYETMRDALDTLALSDSSFSYEAVTSEALGFGYRCGFLGLLHMEIIQERLEREYDIDLPLETPFSHPTLAELARVAEDRILADAAEDVDRQDGSEIGQLVNISEDGMMLLLDRPLAGNTILQLSLELAGHGDAFARAEEELRLVGLGSRSGHYPSQLSGGEQQRVAVARALASQPSFVLADEPTGNLDEKTGRQIVDLMFKAQETRGMTLVLVTHSLQVAKRADRVLMLDQGRVALELAPVDVNALVEELLDLRLHAERTALADRLLQ